LTIPFTSLPLPIQSLLQPALAMAGLDPDEIEDTLALTLSMDDAPGALAVALGRGGRSWLLANVPLARTLESVTLTAASFMQMLSALPQVPGGIFSPGMNGRALYFTLGRPAAASTRAQAAQALDGLVRAYPELARLLRAMFEDGIAAQDWSQLEAPAPALPQIKMTPKDAVVILDVLASCTHSGEEFFRLLIEKWARAGFFVETTAQAVVLDAPYGPGRARLAMLHPGGAALAALMNGADPSAASLTLMWDNLRERTGFPPEAIEAYQAAVGKRFTLDITESAAQVEGAQRLDEKQARALLKAMLALVRSVDPLRIEPPPPPGGPVTPGNIELTLAECDEAERAVFARLVDGWKEAGGTVQCTRPGRIALKMKTTAHATGRLARRQRNFSLAVLAAPRGRRPASITLAWNLGALALDEFFLLHGDESSTTPTLPPPVWAYLDCIPEAAGAYERAAAALPGFEQRGVLTHIWLNPNFGPPETETLLAAMLALREAEQAAE
jgi:hypothetical protein